MGDFKLQKRFYMTSLRMSMRQARVCEQIADDYAIEFAKWISDNLHRLNPNSSHKELLEIFKEENNH